MGVKHPTKKGYKDMNIEFRRLGYDEIINNCFAQFKAFNDAFSKDIYPDENPDTEDRLKEIIHERDCDFYRFTAFDGDKIVGSISSGKLKPEHPEYSSRKHVSWLEGFVLPQYRRRGIGKQLVRQALEMASQNGVEVVKPYTYCDEGFAFIESLGGKAVSAQSDRTLELDKLDWSLVESWLKIPIGDLKLEYFSEFSDELMERLIDVSFASTQEVSAMDSCEVPPTLDGERHSLREFSDYIKNTGTRYHCLLLTDEAGNILGYTEGTIPPEDPDVFRQAMTMVWKHHRGKGYGKFLKAAMLDFIRKNLPNIKKQVTGNNDLNAPMLAINLKLGFQLVRQWKVYRVEVAKALDNLKM